MKKDTKKIYDDDLDLEEILRPRCEFSVSPGFKERVTSEVHSIRRRRRYRRILYLSSSVAAIIVAIVVIATLHFSKTETHRETIRIIATTEKQTITTSDTIKINTKPQLVAAAALADSEKEQVAKMIPTKKETLRQAKSSNAIIMEAPMETDSQQVTGGEMPMIKKEESLDPDEVRTRLIETRRNAEIAYIERMREEIEANQAYISQLMTEGNVYQ